MSSRIVQIKLTLEDLASKALKGAGKSFSNFGQNLKSAEDASNKFAIGLTAGVTAASLAGFKMAETAGKYNSVKDAFGSMTKGMGINAEDFEKNVGDASAGTLDKLTILQGGTRALSLIGKEAFSDFGGQFAQMAELSKKAARATGQDVTYMFDSLITGMSRESKMILDNLGITVDLVAAKEEYAKSIGKEVSELTVSEEKTAVLNETLKKLEGTYGDVAASSGGLSGAVSKLKSTLKDTQIEIGQELAPAFNELIRVITPLIKEHVPKMIQGVKDLIKFFAENEGALIVVAGAITGMLVPSIWAAILAFKAFALTLAPFMIQGAIIGGLIAGIYAIYKNWDTISAKMSDIGHSIGGGIRTFFIGIQETIGGVFNWISDKYNTMIGWFGNLGDKASNIVSSAGSSAGSFLKNMLNFDTGGIVPGAVGQPVPAIVHGGEMVIPVGGRMGGGMVVNINGGTYLDRDSGRKLAEQISQYLRFNQRL